MFWNFIVGGMAGWLLANLMGANKAIEKTEVTPEQALEVLVKNIHDEAALAMGECTTDEERELVYAEVKKTVQMFQLNLQEKGEEIIAALRGQVDDNPISEEVVDPVERRVNEFKNKMGNLSDKLNQTLSELNPKTSIV